MPTPIPGHTFEPNRTRAPDLLYAEPHWYACYTRARHEKKADALLARQKVESYLPLAPRVSQWKDRKKAVNWPLFPGYVLVRFTLDSLSRVLSTHGIVSIVSQQGYPTPIPASEIESVRLLCAALTPATGDVVPAETFNTGDWVRVMSGPFSGVEGTVIERREGSRILVGIRAIGQALQVDIGTASLVSIPAPNA